MVVKVERGGGGCNESVIRILILWPTEPHVFYDWLLPTPIYNLKPETPKLAC